MCLLLQRCSPSPWDLQPLQPASANLCARRMQVLQGCRVSRDALMDNPSRSARSERMSRIRSKDTTPELIVRRLLHARGYRYRLHRAGLPGRPDIVFPARSKVIFVHGCFWHRHPGCCRTPKSRADFWLTKFRANRRRDLRNQRRLTEMGWDFLVVWECEIRYADGLVKRVVRFLDKPLNRPRGRVGGNAVR